MRIALQPAFLLHRKPYRDSSRIYDFFSYLLSSISNPNALNDIFYPNLYQLGFKSAFELTFNKTLEEFYIEWDSIMEKSIDERIELINSFGF